MTISRRTSLTSLSSALAGAMLAACGSAPVEPLVNNFSALEPAFALSLDEGVGRTTTSKTSDVGVLTGSMDWAPGRTGRADDKSVSITGDGYIAFQTPNSLKNLSYVRTCAWIKLARYPAGWAGIVTRQTSGYKENFGLYVNNRRLTFVSNDAIIEGDADLPLNQWQRVCAEYDSVTKRAALTLNCQQPKVVLDFNGNLDNTTDNPIIIGANQNNADPPSEFFTGQIDDVSIYNTSGVDIGTDPTCSAKCPVGDFPVSLGKILPSADTPFGSTIYRGGREPIALTNGTVLATYLDGSSGGQFVVGRIFSNDAVALTDEFVVAANTTGVSVAPLTDGKFAVSTTAFVGTTGDDSFTTIQTFAADGRPLTARTAANTSRATASRGGRAGSKPSRRRIRGGI